MPDWSEILEEILEYAQKENKDLLENCESIKKLIDDNHYYEASQLIREKISQQILR